MNTETQQKMVSSLQDEQSQLNHQITQLQLAVQEKDSRIQYVLFYIYMEICRVCLLCSEILSRWFSCVMFLKFVVLVAQ